jgi:hypothetical protein
LSPRKCWFLSITKLFPKKSSALFNCGQNMKYCFLSLIFLAQQILEIAKLQIEMKKILFFNKGTHKVEKMLFTIKKFIEVDIYKQKLAKWF